MMKSRSLLFHKKKGKTFQSTLTGYEICYYMFSREYNTKQNLKDVVHILNKEKHPHYKARSMHLEHLHLKHSISMEYLHLKHSIFNTMCN